MSRAGSGKSSSGSSRSRSGSGGSRSRGSSHSRNSSSTSYRSHYGSSKNSSSSGDNDFNWYDSEDDLTVFNYGQPELDYATYHIMNEEEYSKKVQDTIKLKKIMKIGKYMLCIGFIGVTLMDFMSGGIFSLPRIIVNGIFAIITLLAISNKLNNMYIDFENMSYEDYLNSEIVLKAKWTQAFDDIEQEHEKQYKNKEKGVSE